METTVTIVCTIITAISVVVIGALCAYYKHFKNK